MLLYTYYTYTLHIHIRFVKHLKTIIIYKIVNVNIKYIKNLKIIESVNDNIKKTNIYILD